VYTIADLRDRKNEPGGVEVFDLED